MTVGGMGFIPERLLMMMMMSLFQSIPPDHGKQTTASTKERGSRDRKLLGANAKSYRLKLSRLVSKAKDYGMVP